MQHETHEYLSRHPFLRTDDLDRSREVMKTIWSDHRVTLRSGIHFETAINHVNFARAGLTYVNCHSSLSVGVRPTTRYVVYLPEGGATEFVMDRHRLGLDLGSAVVVAPGLDLTMATEPSRVLALTFSKEEVDRALAGRGLGAACIEHSGSEIDLDSRHGATLQSLCRWAAGELDREGSPLVSGLPAEQLSESLLTLLVGSLEAQVAPADRRDALVGVIRMSDLETWIRESLKKPLSLSILADVAGASRRSVQESFRRYRGCTPTEFIRRLRLEQVRRELERGEPHRSVTQTALDHGFFHLGRFARAYREHFGESPSETLQRSQGSHQARRDLRP